MRIIRRSYLSKHPSKYKPHHGEAERARRKRQIEKGQLKKENGLVN